jgi:hypothetical protein
MGRGRAKAKQTKVARELKYRSFDTDFDQLEKELRGDGSSKADDVEDDYADDEYSEDGGPRR